MMSQGSVFETFWYRRLTRRQSRSNAYNATEQVAVTITKMPPKYRSGAGAL
jgi:hypothetical protein